MIVVDARWRGRHGIARFAAEVLPRLGVDAATLDGDRSPTSGRDLLNPVRMRLGRRDLVYSPGFNVGLTRARQLVTLHDLIHLDEPAERSTAKQVYYDRLVRPAVERAGTVLTVSPTSARRVERWLGPRSRTRVIDVGNGCSSAFLDRATTAPPGDGRFLYVGNLKPHKNTGVLFAALARRPEYRLTVVTSDEQEGRAQAAAHGVASRTDFVSGINDAALADLYAAHDGTLLPSRLEGFGLPALESVAVGRRVAHHRGCESVAGIVGSDGVSVAALDDASAWAEAMDELLHAGAAVRREEPRWRASYDWTTVAERVRKVVLELAETAAHST